MTTRHAGYVITLEKDIREDDSQSIIEAIKMIRGIVRVEPIETGFDIHIATARAETEMHRRIFEAIYEKKSCQ